MCVLLLYATQAITVMYLDVDIFNKDAISGP